MRRLWLVPALALVLAGCGSDDPRAQLRGEVADVTSAANLGDPDALREEVEELLALVRRQVTDRKLSLEEGESLRAIALRIAENADLVAPEPAPSPAEEEPSPEPSPSPSPEPSPSPSPEPSPEPEPSEEPEEEPSEEPEEEEEPILEITPAAMSPSSAPAESSPSPPSAQSKQQPTTPSPAP